MNLVNETVNNLTFTVTLKKIMMNGETDRKTSVSFHPVIRAQSNAPNTRAKRAMKSGTLSLEFNHIKKKEIRFKWQT